MSEVWQLCSLHAEPHVVRTEDVCAKSERNLRICEPQQIAEKTFKNRLLIILFFTFYYAKRQQETHIRRQHKYTNTIQ